MQFIFKAGLLSSLALILWSCGLSNRRAELKSDEFKPQAYSLKADRSELKDLRASVPEETRQRNDEMAFVLELLKDEKLSPSEVRSRFSAATRRKENAFREALKKERDDFRDAERKAREGFLEEQEDARQDFNESSSGRDRKARSVFYDDQDAARKEFFARSRDQRRAFEDEARQKRKDFDAMMRTQRDYFKDELKLYGLRYKARKTEREAEMKALKQELKDRQAPKGPGVNAVKEVQSEFQSIPDGPGEVLNQ